VYIIHIMYIIILLLYIYIYYEYHEIITIDIYIYVLCISYILCILYIYTYCVYYKHHVYYYIYIMYIVYTMYILNYIYIHFLCMILLHSRVYTVCPAQRSASGTMSAVNDFDTTQMALLLASVRAQFGPPVRAAALCVPQPPTMGFQNRMGRHK